MPGRADWRARNGIDRRRWERARLAALRRDGWRCRDCGRLAFHAGRPEVDHVIPLAAGGPPYELANLATRCAPCHREKTRQENSRPLTAAEKRWEALVSSLRV